METYEQYEADIMSFQNLLRADKSDKYLYFLAYCPMPQFG